MAVVSISRIQVRRGQRNTGSGLPQLASGEFGWAVDTQELFIGNGSVSEGAPYVGNTKLLSENDNLFAFANTYSYKNSVNVQTGESPNNPVLRTLQDRLDDRVSIRAFGAAGDGTNQTAALQRAIDQLYLNSSNKGQSQARVELILEPGIYTITSTIYVPPYATIRGAGANKTIINSGAFEAFQTVNETSVPGAYASDSVSTTLNQARNIIISDLTINSTGGTALSLVSCKDSIFKDLILTGSYSLGDTVNGNIDGIRLFSLSTAVSSNNNLFDNVVVNGFVTAVKSDNDINDNIWENCTFDTLWQGFSLGLNTILGTSGMLTGPINNIVTQSKFDNIYQHAIQIANGTDNISKNNKFYNIGASGGDATLTEYAIIKFESNKNTSSGDWFQRSEELGHLEEYRFTANSYYPEVEGPTITEFDITHVIGIGQVGESTVLFRLPAETTKGYEIDYIYKSDVVGTRSGTMGLVVYQDGASPNNRFNFSDEYDFIGPGNAESLQFTAALLDQAVSGTYDTVGIMIQNSTANDAGTLHYKVKIKS